MRRALFLSSELTSLLQRLGVGLPKKPQQPEGLCIVASVLNLRGIEQAYGTTMALAVRHALQERARKVCEAEGGVATVSGDHILFVFDAPFPPLQSDDANAIHATLLMEDVLSSLADQPVEVAGTRLYLSVSTSVAPFTDEPFDIDAFGENDALPAPGGRLWRGRFTEDMAVARELLDALFADELGLEWEPVRDARRDGPVHYYEALLCNKSGSLPRRVGCDVPALERLGLVRRLDQWVVESTIETLRLNRDVSLGCNISAQSAKLDIWWALIIETLAAEPDVASRLVVEITESAPLQDMKSAGEFVRSLQALGCRIALDDVGSGHSCLKALLELGVDVVKIDAVHIRRARHDVVEARRLLHLVNLARSCASHVVLEGIESKEDVELSRASGATGLQGYLYPMARPHDLVPPPGRHQKRE